MADFTRAQWLRLSAGTIALLRGHGADVADLIADIPKAIGLAHDIASLLEQVRGVPATSGPAALRPDPVGAHELARDVGADGLTPQEKAMFDRASGSNP